MRINICIIWLTTIQLVLVSSKIPKLWLMSTDWKSAWVWFFHFWIRHQSSLRHCVLLILSKSMKTKSTRMSITANNNQINLLNLIWSFKFLSRLNIQYLFIFSRELCRGSRNCNSSSSPFLMLNVNYNAQCKTQCIM